MALPSTRLIALALSLIAAASACGDDSAADRAGADASADGGAASDHDDEQSRDAAACEAGTLGCPCGTGKRCATDSHGGALICSAGFCEMPGCPLGDQGCACRLGTECNDRRAECSDGVCMPAGCAPGSEHCACLAGTCDPGLFCRDATVCADARGREGGPCLDNGACLRGARCDRDLETCVHCELGTEGCACSDGSACSSGLACSAGTCVSASSLPPASPSCYTPCLADLHTDSETRRCDSDGLIAGCVGGKQCVAGTCLSEGEDAPACADEMECPFFQTCIQDHCYSTCSVNADCAAGLGCFRKVCRAPCSNTLGAAPCPTGMSCVSPDGENGFCSPSGKLESSSPAEAAAATVRGGISVGEERLELSNLFPKASFPIVNGTDRPLQVTVHKLWHLVHFADGSSERVDAPRDPASGQFRECNSAKGECPLYWLQLGNRAGKEQQVNQLELTAANGCTGSDCPNVYVEGGASGPGVRWEGELLVESAAGSARVAIQYVQTPEARWAGTMYYLSSFGDEGLGDWAASPDKGVADDVKNAFIQVWSAFRRGSLDNFEEMLDVVNATRSETWKSDRVRELCSAVTNGSDTAVCYPHPNPTGVRVYTQNDQVTPVPSGVTELPIALHLRRDRADRTKLSGAIDSATALHYPSQPSVSLDFVADPGALNGNCDPRIVSDCVVFLEDFSADVAVGGRYHSSDGTCEDGFAARDEPWMLPDFLGDTRFDAVTRSRRRTECRNEQMPYPVGSDASAAIKNAFLSGANPAPDGFSRTRHLRLLDGALINQNELFVLFEESFPSFLPDVGARSVGAVTAYGFMMLRRDAREMAPSDYESVAAVTTGAERSTPAEVSCSADLIARVGTADPEALTNALLFGRGSSSDYVPVSGAVYPHYLCEETGVFDAGRVTPGQTGPGIGCPTGSKVTYFLTDVASLNDAECQADVKCSVELQSVDGGVGSVDGNGLVVRCQQPGTCKSTLNQWLASGTVVTEQDPLWQCTSGSYCDGNRFDLREGKQFFRYAGGGPTPEPIAPIATEIDTAFRYKTRFTSASGTNIGFAPKQCLGGSDQVPYCYDASLIEDLRARLDCLLDLYSHQIGALSNGTRANLEQFLRGSFAQLAPGKDGFERLYAELLVMLGDDAVSSSFASRFDLAASNGAAFFGSQLEEGGIDLSGVPGFEMVKLYQGIQYYQLALDRMYLLGPSFAAALSRGTTSNSAVFVSPETVTMYLERLAGASAKKARAWNEVAKRYLSLNRPDLARAVVSREYVRTYLEGVLLGKLMAQITELSRTSNKDQLRLVLEQAQRGYRMALLGMGDVFRSIDDDTTIFGFQPDYIPFPALDTSTTGDTSTNAFDVLAGVAQRKIEAAAQREETALSLGKTERIDSASFQAELVRIRNTYEDQLADLCGTFQGDDGRIYPATEKYAALSEPTRLMGDPCGRTGNGQIRDAFFTVDDAKLNMRGALARAQETIGEIQIERERVSQQCGLTAEMAEYEYLAGGRKLALSKQVQQMQFDMGVAQRTLDTVVQGASAVAGCELTGCISAAVAAGVIVAALTASNVTVSLQEKAINEKENELAQSQLETGKWLAQKQCDAAVIDSNARTRTLALGLAQSEIEILRANLQVQLAAGTMQKLVNEAKRLRGQQVDAEQMLIDVEAARNDPNVRIYRNDAIINADFSFDDALKAVYRATRVFEYYTSQSYAKKEQLFLIRMVAAGEFNLQTYLAELQNAFFEFQETYGIPDTRVAVLSLRDDVLRIPLLDDDGNPYTRDQRVAQMRERLRDPGLLDESGYIVLPFGISLEQLSPVTRNHKIRYMEADIVGSNIGDTLGRLYVRQAGTSSLRTLADTVDQHAFPERLAVLNTFFNGSRVYGPDVYRSYRLRDRPIANSLYELVINQRDEAVNADIDLQSLTDIRLLIYYDDFTKL